MVLKTLYWVKPKTPKEYIMRFVIRFLMAWHSWRAMRLSRNLKTISEVDSDPMDGLKRLIHHHVVKINRLATRAKIK